MSLWTIVLAALWVSVAYGDGNNPISAPQARETITAERPYQIEWKPRTPGPVKIELHYADTSYVNITGT